MLRMYLRDARPAKESRKGRSGRRKRESHLLVSVMLCASALDAEIHIAIAGSASFEQAALEIYVIFAITAQALITQLLDY